MVTHRGWSYLRRESKARTILSRRALQELGLTFECHVCGCIHLGGSLPDTAVRDFGRTSICNAPEFVFRTLPSLYEHESDGVTEAGVTTVGVVSPHGVISNSSTVKDPSTGSTGNSQAEISKVVCPSPKPYPS